MSKRNREYLESRFEHGDVPTQEDFKDLIETLLEVPFYNLDPATTGPGLVPSYVVATEAELPVITYANPGSEVLLWAKVTGTGCYYRCAVDGTWENMGGRNYELPPYLAGSNGELRLRVMPVLSNIVVDRTVATMEEMAAIVTELPLVDDGFMVESTDLPATGGGQFWKLKRSIGAFEPHYYDFESTECDCFIRLPTDESNPIETNLITQIGLDIRYFIDTSLNGHVSSVTRTFVTSKRWTRCNGNRNFYDFGQALNDATSFRISYKDHWAFECYPVVVEGVLKQAAWTPAGDTAMMFHYTDNEFDGWGNPVHEPNSSGGMKRYTLTERQMEVVSAIQNDIGSNGPFLKGVANGLATLDAEGKVPSTQLPESTGGGTTVLAEPVFTIVDPALYGLGLTYMATGIADDLSDAPAAVDVPSYVRTVSGFSFRWDGAGWQQFMNLTNNPRTSDLSLPVFVPDLAVSKHYAFRATTYLDAPMFILLPDAADLTHITLVADRNNYVQLCVFFQSTGFDARWAAHSIFGGGTYNEFPVIGAARDFTVINQRWEVSFVCQASANPNELKPYWFPVTGPTVLLADSRTGMDGWGNDAQIASDGASKRYTLSEDEYNNLANLATPPAPVPESYTLTQGYSSDAPYTLGDNGEKILIVPNTVVDPVYIAYPPYQGTVQEFKVLINHSSGVEFGIGQVLSDTRPFIAPYNFNLTGPDSVTTLPLQQPTNFYTLYCCRSFGHIHVILDEQYVRIESGYDDY
jgi:hypothetical protein